MGGGGVEEIDSIDSAELYKSFISRRRVFRERKFAAAGLPVPRIYSTEAPLRVVTSAVFQVTIIFLRLPLVRCVFFLLGRANEKDGQIEKRTTDGVAVPRLARRHFAT